MSIVEGKQLINLKEFDNITCPICTQIFHNVVMVNNPSNDGKVEMCGHQFCLECIQQALKAKSACPLCRQYIDNNCTEDKILIPNMEMRRTIADLSMHCVNREHGCTWSGIIGKNRQVVLEHYNKCTFRGYTCQVCQDVVSWLIDAKQHEAVCPKVQVQCKTCDMVILQCNTILHESKECAERPIKCMFHGLIDDCKEEMPFSKLNVHNLFYERQHLDVISKVMEQKNTIAHQQNQLKSAKRKLENMEKTKIIALRFKDMPVLQTQTFTGIYMQHRMWKINIFRLTQGLRITVSCSTLDTFRYIAERKYDKEYQVVICLAKDKSTEVHGRLIFHFPQDDNVNTHAIDEDVFNKLPLDMINSDLPIHLGISIRRIPDTHVTKRIRRDAFIQIE